MAAKCSSNIWDSRKEDSLGQCEKDNQSTMRTERRKMHSAGMSRKDLNSGELRKTGSYVQWGREMKENA